MTKKLKIGTIIQVKSESEIFAALDEHGTLDGLPFIFEMREFCGKTYKVLKVLNRIHIDGLCRRSIHDTVILDGVRCNGKAHGGCGRLCYLLFKSAWLNVLEKDNLGSNISQTSEGIIDEPPFWKDHAQLCQGNSIQLVKATKDLSASNIRQYINDIKTGLWRPRDVASILLFRLNRKWDSRQPIWALGLGNRSFKDLAQMAFIVLWQTARWHLDRAWRTALQDAKSRPVVKPQNPSTLPLNLRPGEMVEVKSREEILATLDSRERNKGLAFTGSMVKDCGKKFRVLSKICGVIDERTGKQVKVIKDTVLLEGSICNGISWGGCPRECCWFWREAWLKRLEG